MKKKSQAWLETVTSSLARFPPLMGTSTFAACTLQATEPDDVQYISLEVTSEEMLGVLTDAIGRGLQGIETITAVQLSNRSHV